MYSRKGLLLMSYLPLEEKLDIRLLENIFNSMTNSYKLYWFNSIFEEIIKGKSTMSFKKIVNGMIATSWYPLMAYNLNFGVQDQLENIVIEVNNTYIKNKEIKKSQLYNYLEETENKQLEKSILALARYVPYRLLTPFYEKELKRLKDGEKNKVIENLASNDDDVLYKISSKTQEIYINEKWFNYIYKNQNIIRGWLNYKIIEFLQLRNPNVPSIINKLAPPENRELTLGKKYWKEIISGIDICDIYSGLEFTKANYKDNGVLSIDHFIPWSYIGHDRLWNLIPTFDNINSSKNDKLPMLSEYMDKYCEIQFSAINYIRKTPKSGQFLEEYLDIDKMLDIRAICSVKGDLNKDKFKEDLLKVIKPIYQMAYNQGFGEWIYNEKFTYKDADRSDAKIVNKIEI